MIEEKKDQLGNGLVALGLTPRQRGDPELKVREICDTILRRLEQPKQNHHQPEAKD